MLMHNRGGGFMVILWSVLKSSMRIYTGNGTRVFQCLSYPRRNPGFQQPLSASPSPLLSPSRYSNTLTGHLFISLAMPSRALSRSNEKHIGVCSAVKRGTAFVWIYGRSCGFAQS